MKLKKAILERVVDIDEKEYLSHAWLIFYGGAALVGGFIGEKIAHFNIFNYPYGISGFSAISVGIIFVALGIFRLKCYFFNKDKEIKADNLKQKDDRCSTEWRDLGNGYMERFGWVLICGGWMVSEEEGEMTSKPERMKVFSDLNSVLVYKEERGGRLKDAHPHYATLCVKIEEKCF